MKKKSLLFKISIASLAVIIILTSVCALYLGDYYRASEDAVSAFAVQNDPQVRTLDDGSLFFEPASQSENSSAFIFYPGGKVEHTAYIPLMKAISAQGVPCILVKMPFHLAVFDMDAAMDYRDEFSQIQNWYAGGHSLGGAMAASCLSKHDDLFDGLVLLGAYSASDLSQTDLQVLSVYGTEDSVMNREKYSEYRSNLPDSFQELVIEGGCHSYFGMYGAQEGDGFPSVSNEEQIKLTADAIVSMMQK